MNQPEPTSTEDIALPPARRYPNGRPSAYPPEQIKRALLILAHYGGNSKAAATHLADIGQPIPDSTLRDWRSTRYHELYNELHDTYSREIEAALIPEIRDTARRAAHGTQLAVEATITQLETGQAKDPATTARNLATTAAINIDKLLLLTNRPTAISEHRDIAGILNSLAANIPGVDANTTATEEPDQTEDITPARVLG